MCQSKSNSEACECETKPKGVRLSYDYTISEQMFRLSYTQFTYQIDRQLEEMKRALYHTAIGHFREFQKNPDNAVPGTRIEFTRE